MRSTRLAVMCLSFATLAAGARAQETPLPLGDVNPGTAGSQPGEAIDVDGTVFFVAETAAHGRELWKTDGTAAGTMMVADIRPGPESSNPRRLRRHWTGIMFVADDGVYGAELWRSDRGATWRVSDVVPGSGSGQIDALESIHASLTLFRACTPDAGCELWKTDGWTTGLVLDIRPGPASSQPQYLTRFGDHVYFSADDGVHGAELWKSDGWTTVLVKDIHPVVDGNGIGISSFPAQFLGGSGTQMYFVAEDVNAGRELWRTDGTEAGTWMVVDLNPGRPFTYYHGLTWYGSTLVFAVHGFYQAPGLYRTDGPGTTTGIGAIDIEMGTLVNAGGTLYFSGSRDGQGYELWKSDGTYEGTSLVADINPAGDAQPAAITATGGATYFVADDGASGRQLWRTDGTAAGTQRAATFAVGFPAPLANVLVRSGDRLFFAADDGLAGLEPWTLVPNRAPVANAGPDQRLGPAGPVTLDGSASSDPDGDTLTYEWSDAAGAVLGTTAVLTLGLTLGEHTLTLSVSDGTLTATDEVVVTVAPTVTLTVEVNLFEGAVGYVQVDPPAQACGDLVNPTTTCAFAHAPGTVVTLTPIYPSDMGFASWTGACTGIGPCVVTVDADTWVGAMFRGPQTLHVRFESLENGYGGATVSPGNGQCWGAPGLPHECSFPFAPGTVVTLAAIPAPDSVFVGWGGPCVGQGACVVLLEQAQDVLATFRGPQTLNVVADTVENGFGSVTVSPGNGMCSNSPGQLYTCSYMFQVGTTVTLEALPAPESVFVGWVGACTGTGPCQVTMQEAATVGAIFRGPQTLNVVADTVENGFGSVTVSPGNGMCSNSPGQLYTCSYMFQVGTTVTLEALPAPESVFVGWVGACFGTGPCQVTMQEAATVGVIFRGPQRLDVATHSVNHGWGWVNVSPLGETCYTSDDTTQTCSYLLRLGTQVVLEATALPDDSVFLGWSGACSGTGTCIVTLDQARQVTATFRGPELLTVTAVSVDGGVGRVESALGACGTGANQTWSCPYREPFNTVVTLQAVPEGDTTFAGWSGACTGTGPCQVTMDQARQVTATFRGPQVLTIEITNVDGPAAGAGEVVFEDGRRCGSPSAIATCHFPRPLGDVVTLTAVPVTYNTTFIGWTGACTGTGTCLVTMDQARQVTATFAGPRVLTITVSAADTGRGRVRISRPPSADALCTNDPMNPQQCAYPYGPDDVVTLTAESGFQSVFLGWSGACSGTGSCVVPMEGAISVGAVFGHQNQAPVANAGGGYTGVRQQPIVFDGTASSDVEGDPLTYAWDFGDGTTGTGANPTHTYATVGTFTVTLAVHDGQLASNPSFASVTITNRPPNANAGGPYAGVRGQSIAFSGSGTDPDGDSLAHAWDFGDGSTGTGASPTHAYTMLGTFTARLTVDDGLGGTAQANTTVTITNLPPTAAPGGPYAGFRNTAIAFNGSGSSDPDGDALTHAWDFGDGTTGTGASPTHAYSALGTYTVTLVVTDGHTSSAPVTTSVTISNRPPVANAGPDRTVAQRTTVTLAGSGADPDGTIVGYQWRQVSGTPVAMTNANAPSMRFTAPKAHNGTLTLMFELKVTDNDGATATDQVTVTVTR